MKTIYLALAAAACGVALLAGTAQADRKQPEPLTLTLALPVEFFPATDQCPIGVVTAGIVAPDGETGKHIACVQSFAEVRCPESAFLCLEYSILLTLRLTHGSITAPVALAEISTCDDPACTTFTAEQTWTGIVTKSTGSLHGFKGAPLSGGGTGVIDGTTGEWIDVDEQLTIG
jgi:hypothetical protein